MEHSVRTAPCQQGNLDIGSGIMNKKYNAEVLMMLKIWNNYYLDASRVCYTLKKVHTKADGGGSTIFVQGWKRRWQRL